MGGKFSLINSSFRFLRCNLLKFQIQSDWLFYSLKFLSSNYRHDESWLYIFLLSKYMLAELEISYRLISIKTTTSFSKRKNNAHGQSLDYELKPETPWFRRLTIIRTAFQALFSIHRILFVWFLIKIVSGCLLERSTVLRRLMN